MAPTKKSESKRFSLSLDSDSGVCAHLGGISELGVFTIDTDGELGAWSLGAEKITGFAYEDLTGEAWQRVFEGQGSQAKQAILDLANGERSQISNLELRIYASDSTELRLLVNGRSIRTANEPVRGAIVTFVDLTDLRRGETVALAPKATKGLGKLVGQSHAMEEVFRRLQLAADSDVTTCITGESGTGKELAARAIHDLGARRSKPFVAINCSAIPEPLLESELFGHLKGAFTGATRNRAGVFETANGGTLFLDEIGDVSPLLQLKLLRCLQEREVRRVGADVAVPIDVRLVTATNRDLRELVAAGAIREDFYYRIRVYDVHMPPLRDRVEDLAPLAQHFLDQATQRQGRQSARISIGALDSLQRYPWPGNVRELQNAMEHALVVQRGEVISASDLPAIVQEIGDIRSSSSKYSTMKDQQGAERLRILAALDAHDWNRTKSAEALGISRVTLWKKIRRFRIDEGVFRRSTKNDLRLG
ncbi:MAG: sigma 54-interacting transcriptional regulator [Planctomycetota bacterium]